MRASTTEEGSSQGFWPKSLTSRLRISLSYMQTALVFAVLAIPCAARAQADISQIGSQDQRLPSSFEVASVKRNSGTPSGRMAFQASAGGRLTAENMPYGQ